MCRHFPLSACVWAALILSAIPARANLIITPTFDSSITGDANAASIENTIDAAIAVFESTYSTSITVPIYFQECSGGCLGESNFFFYTENYSAYYNALVATDANAAAIAGLTANGGNSAKNPVTGTTSIDLKSADARAVGIDIAPGCDPTGAAGSKGCTFGNNASSVDGIISLNTSITYPPGANNGSTYGLMSTVEHEIDEILGLGSSIPDTSASSGTANFFDNNPAPEDLFRYSAPGTFAGSVNCPGSQNTAYFSYNGATVLSYFNNLCNGGDFGDWESNPIPAGFAAQVQDAFATPGAQPLYGINEVAALRAIGYTTTVPEAATWILLLTSVPTFVFVRRQRLSQNAR